MQGKRNNTLLSNTLDSSVDLRKAARVKVNKRPSFAMSEQKPSRVTGCMLPPLSSLPEMSELPGKPEQEYSNGRNSKNKNKEINGSLHIFSVAKLSHPNKPVLESELISITASPETKIIKTTPKQTSNTLQGPIVKKKTSSG